MPSPSPTAASPRRSGFTIVELLVVMAIIAALMGLLLVSLQAARRTGKVTKEKNSLRQLHLAWTQYASTYDDSAMPGYIEPSVQENNWKVKYKSKDGTVIPSQYASSYPHRLLPYLDHSYETLYEYLEAGDDDFFKATLPDGTFNTTGVKAMSLNPAFGYNGYYIGGYWRDVNGTANLRFNNSLWKNADNFLIRGKIVTNKTATLADQSRFIVFCGSATRANGIYKKDKEDEKGAALVVPHTLGEAEMWLPTDGTNFGNVEGSNHAMLTDYFPTLAQSGNFSLVQAAGAAMRVQASGEIGVPFRRFGAQVSVVHADGSTVGAGLGELLDQSRWINAAFEARDRNTFTHTDPAQ